MRLKLAIRVGIIFSSLAFVTIMAAAQEVVRQGPSPGIRELLDGFVQAVNSARVDAWEEFAQAHFAQALLQKETSAARAERYQRLIADVGAIELERVTRQAPGAPLELNVRGSKESGVIVLEVDAGSPPRIAGMRVQLGDQPRAVADSTIPPPPIDRTLAADEIDRRLDGYVTKLAAAGEFSGVVLVARAGEPVFLRAYGLADREKQIPNTVRTRFNIGSINKAFTQAAIRQLVGEGRLAYSDTLGRFFPEYPQAVSRSATIEQLLGHRGGLADFFGPEFTRADKARFTSNADYFRFVSALPPLFAPGEREQYCNGCYIALGAIVERVSGMRYEQYVAEKVFAPAGMTSTGYPRSDRPEPDIAQGYTRRGGGSLTNNIEMHGVTGSAAGGGYSTAPDLLAYVKAVRSGRFPGANPEMGIAGGAPGINAIVEVRGEWVSIVLANLDPPIAMRLGTAVADALSR